MSRPARLLAWAPLVVAIAWSVVVLTTGTTTQSWQPGYDLAVYRAGAGDLLAGRDLYERVTERGHYFVYPPFAAVLFLPLLLLPVGVDLAVWDVLLLAALVAGGGRLLRVAGVPARRVPTALAVVVVSDPFREALVLGQVSPLVVLALVAGTALAGSRPRLGGVLAGAAAAVKVTPALVLVLAVARPWRRLAVAAAVVGAGLTALGGLAAPASWRSYFLRELWQSSRVAEPGTTSNNSLAGAFAHAGLPAGPSSALGSAAGAVVVLVLLVAARRLGRLPGRTPLHAGLAVSLATCLVSPVTWSHHALAAPLAAVLLAGTAGGRMRWVAVAAGVPWLLPVLQAAAAVGGPLGVLLAESRPVSELVLLGALLRRGRLPIS